MAHEVAGFEEFVHRIAFRLRIARMSARDLSALVSARLCHDLISPMGAIGNGLELLQMSAGAGSAELDLISDSVGTALAKLRFYRIAFGPADPQARLTAEDASEITGAMYVGRFSVAWKPATRSSMPRDVARVVFLAILCLEKSLPMGGLVRVSTAEDAVSLNVEDRRTAAPGTLWAHVTDGRDIAELRPDCVQFPLLRQALTDTGARLSAEFTEDSAALRLTVRSPLPA
jgi:histidine phosphotransferase ChpT